MFRARQYGTQQDEQHAGARSCLSLSAFRPQAATDLPPAACTGMLGANQTSLPRGRTSSTQTSPIRYLKGYFSTPEAPLEIFNIDLKTEDKPSWDSHDFSEDQKLCPLCTAARDLPHKSPPPV